MRFALIFVAFLTLNAANLNESIKNVNIDGELRYHYETQKKTSNIKEKEAHEYKARLTFSADIAENYQAVGGFWWQNEDYSYGNNALLDDKKTFLIREAFLRYNEYDTTFDMGRVVMDSFWTDELLATGLKITNTGMNGIVLQIFAYDNYSNSPYLSPFFKDTNNLPTHRNFYGGKIVANYSGVDLGIWAGHLDSLLTLYAIDYRLKFNEDMLFIHFQYAGSTFSNTYKEKYNKQAKKDKTSRIDTGHFYGLEVGFNSNIFDGALGYVGFGKKGRKTIYTIENQDKYAKNKGLIKYAHILMDLDNTYNGSEQSLGKKDYFLASLGLNFDNFRIGVDGIVGTIKTIDKKLNVYEVSPNFSYKYNDRLGFYGYYSKAELKDKKTTKIDKTRFEIKYNF